MKMTTANILLDAYVPIDAPPTFSLRNAFLKYQEVPQIKTKINDNTVFTRV